MNNKKLQEFISTLQTMAKELDETSPAETLNEPAEQSQSAEQEAVQVASQRVDASKAKYFNTIYGNSKIEYGGGMRLASGDYFTVEVDYIGLLASYGKTPEEVESCILNIWGATRIYHIEYEIYNLEYDELVGKYAGVNNFYPVNLAQLYKKYGSANFKFVAQWGTAENIALDTITIIEHHPVSIEIIKPPKKTYYAVGQNFDSTGMVVQLKKTNGTIEVISDYTVSPSENLTRNNKYVNVRYGSCTTKQPIEVALQQIPITRMVQMRTRKDENSVWGTWGPTVEKDVFVNATPIVEYRTILKIDKSQIKLGNYKKSGIRIALNRQSKLEASAGVKHIKVNNMRVAVVPKYTTLFAFVGNVNADETDTLEIAIEYDDYPLQFELYNTVYFCRENDPSTQVENKIIDLAEGKAILNIVDGDVKYEFNDIEANSMPLGIGVSHILCNEDEKLGYGENYRLNLCEKLEYDAVNTNSIVNSHIYTDSYGDKHTFNISFYYIKDGERIYITGEELKKINPVLMNYEGYVVHIEQTTVNNQIFIDTPSDDVLNNGFYKRLQNSSNTAFIPVRWLKCDTLTKGFNKDGNLVFIIDTFGNYIFISYNNNEKIEIVKDGNGNFIKFFYNSNGNLDYLLDSRNRKINYKYSDFVESRLEGVEYCTVEQDGVTENVYKTVSLRYIGKRRNGMTSVGLFSVSTSDNLFSALTYDKSNFNSKLISVRNGSLQNDGEQEEISSLNIEYDFSNNQTIFTDDYDNKQVYKFTNGENLSYYYEIKNGFVSQAQKFSYEPYSSQTVKKAKLSSLNKYTFSGYTFTAGESTVSELNIFNLPEKVTVTNIPVTAEAYKNEVIEYTYNNEHKCIKTVLTETYYELPSDELKYTNVITTNFVYNSKSGKIVKEIIHKAHKSSSNIVNEKSEVTEYEYDTHGSLIKQVNYNLKWNGHNDENCDCSASSTTDKFYKAYSYDENRRISLAWLPDGLNYDTYMYFDGTNCVKNETRKGRSNMYYAYDAADRLKSLSGTDSDIENANFVHYDAGEISQLNHSGNNALNFEYDAKHRISCVKLEDTVYESYVYEDKKNQNGYLTDIVTKTNAKDEKFRITSDRSGSFVYIHYNDAVQLNYQYGRDGILTGISDSVSGINKKMSYDECGNLIRYYECENGSLKKSYTENFLYNAKGNLTRVNYSGVVSRTDEYTYSGNADEKVTVFTTGNFKVQPSYDINNRLISRQVYIGTKQINSEGIVYRKVNDHSTSLPARITFGNIEYGSSSFPNVAVHNRSNVQYSYDVRGNIEKITVDGVLLTEYVYDNLDRIVRENNNAMKISCQYIYDNNGNIVVKEIFPFTLDNLVAGTGEVKLYSYIKDRMTNYDGELCENDVIGNPILYRGNTLVWSHGRRLDSFNRLTFEYDAQGRRTKKGNISYYYDSQGRLIKSSNGLEFFYDGSGLLGLMYGGNSYVYRRDIQGNIIAILDSNGKIVVEYVYNAWGEHRVSGSLASTIGVLNPFRYRGYYYDTETKLYYLNSRYYDPETCRFINMDSISYADPETINGLNLYAYCGNNPIMGYDPDGKSWKSFWNSIGDWFKNDLWKSIDSTLDNVKFFIDNVMASFYCDVGIGVGFGGEVKLFNNISLSAIVAFGLGIKILPDQLAGEFSRVLIGLNFFNFNLSAGEDQLLPFGGNYENKPEVQDFTIGIGVSAFLAVGLYADFGFNVSKFIRLMS